MKTTYIAPSAKAIEMVAESMLASSNLNPTIFSGREGTSKFSTIWEDDENKEVSDVYSIF